jgi:hypothetical protein
MNKLGRPRSTDKNLTTPIMTRLADDEVEALDRKRGTRSRAAAVRLAVLAWLGLGTLLLVGCGTRELPPKEVRPSAVPSAHEGWTAYRTADEIFEIEVVPSVWGLTDDIELASATCANEGARLPTSTEWRVMEGLDFFGASIPMDGISRELFRDSDGTYGWYSVADGVRYSRLSGWYLLRCARTVNYVP